MLKILIFALLGLSLSHCATAPKAVNKPFYWQAKKGDITFCFLGTIHEPVNIHSLPEMVREDMGSSSTVYVEILDDTVKRASREMTARILRPVDDAKFPMSAIARSNMLHMLKSKKVQSWLKEKQFDFPPNKIHPVMAIAILDIFREKSELVNVLSESHYLYLSKLDIDIEPVQSGEVFDSAVQTYAESGGIPVRALDSDKNLEKVIEVLEGLEASMAEVVFGQLSQAELKRSVNAITTLRQSFYSRRKEELAKAVNALPEREFQDLIKKRNESWFQILMKRMKPDSKYFVAVGLGHLIAKDNLIDRFKKAKFEVTEFSF